MRSDVDWALVDGDGGIQFVIAYEGFINTNIFFFLGPICWTAFMSAVPW
jgi:hypothetical protein